MDQTGSRRFKPGSTQPPRNLDFCFIRLFLRGSRFPAEFARGFLSRVRE